MATTNVTIRIDSALKKQSEELFDDLGLSLSAAFTLFLKQAIREQRIPFEIKRLVPNETTIKALEEVEEMEKERDKNKSFDSVDDFIKDLHSWNTNYAARHNLKRIIKTLKKRGYDTSKIHEVIKLLMEGACLPEKYKDHPLRNSKEFKNCRELHIEPDWLLVYKYYNDNVILYMVRTGTHSDIFSNI